MIKKLYVNFKKVTGRHHSRVTNHQNTNNYMIIVHRNYVIVISLLFINNIDSTLTSYF